MPTPEHEQHTQSECLFFALWPDDALRQQLMQYRDTLAAHADGRPIPAENIHLTLAFLGRTDARRRACVETLANAIQCPPFELQLNRSGYWPRPRVWWIAPVEMPEALTALAADLHAGAEGCGLKLDARPYRAHITLMRKPAHSPKDTDLQPLNWPVDRFVLVRSIILPQGVKYEVVREWKLAEEEFGK